MNRLTTWRGFTEPTRDKQRAAPINLSAFVKRSIKTKTPVTHSFGRGYGFRNIKPLGTTLLPEREELQRREMALNRIKVKQEKEGDEVSGTKGKSEKESLNDIITDLVTLTDKEIQTILDKDSTSSDVEQGKTWLEESQFALSPAPNDKEKLMLTKQRGNTKVTVLFRRDYEENEDEEEEEGGEEVQETEEGANEEEVIKNEGNEDWVRSGDELPDRDDMPEKHSLDISIEISDNQGKPKGVLRLNAFAGMDDRLYVEEMICENASNEKVENIEDQPVIIFDDLSDTMQDRIYDYLDELGVDDKMAHFVKTSVAREKKEADVAFLNKFKEILKV